MVKTAVLPAAVLWDLILQRPITINVFEDNRSVLYIVSTGKNRTMRHFERTHRVSAAWLNEIYVKHKYVQWFYAKSQEMLADLFTKQFSNSAQFVRLRTAVGISPTFEAVLALGEELKAIRTREVQGFDPHEHDRPRVKVKAVYHDFSGKEDVVDSKPVAAMSTLPT